MILRKTEKILDSVLSKTPPTLKLQAFGLAKIPLLFAVRPKVIESSRQGCKVMVPLNYMTKNHLGSMYFGALSIGADTVVGLLALDIIEEYKHLKMAPIFKDMKGEFFKRAEEDVVFHCEAGEQIRAMIDKAEANEERVTEAIKVMATAKSNYDEIFAEFELGLSLKARKKKG